jgi:preprotein translocase subunit SecD
MAGLVRWKRLARWAQTVAAVAGLGPVVAVSGCESNLDVTVSAPSTPTSPSLSLSVGGGPAGTASTSTRPSSGHVTVTFRFESGMPATDTLNRELSVIKARITSEKLTGATAAAGSNGDDIVVQGSIADKDRLEMLDRAGVLEFRPVLTTIAAGAAIAGSAPNGVPALLWQKYMLLDCKSVSPTAEPAATQIVACQNDGSQKYVLDATAVSGTSIASASASAGFSGVWQVNVSLNAQGTAQFGQLTTRLYGTNGQVAIAVDGVVYSAPTIQQPVIGGNLQITGKFDQSTAQSLAAILQSGALPAPLVRSSTSIVNG